MYSGLLQFDSLSNTDLKQLYLNKPFTNNILKVSRVNSTNKHISKNCKILQRIFLIYKNTQITKSI